MIRLTVLVSVMLTLATAIPAVGQEVPTIEIDPSTVELGGTTKVTGVGFEPGTIRIFFDGVAGAPEVEHTHRGEFNFLLEVAGVTPDVHELIACNNQSRNGECREEAIAALIVLAPSPTTTTTPRSTTTTAPPRTTTTAPPRTTTTAPPRTTTTAPRRTTTTAPPRTTTTAPRTSSSTSSTRPTTVAPSASLLTTTTESGVSVATTLATDDLGAVTVTTGVPTPTGVQVVGTSAPDLDLSTTDDLDWPDLEVVGFEVTQGIQDLQNRMPLVAERTTWVRLYVAADRLPEAAGDDNLAVGNVGSEWSYSGWPDVTGALLLEQGGTTTVLYPENGPITGFGDGGDRLQRDATLNFLLPVEFTADGELDITAFIWSQLPGTPASQEPDPANNYAGLTVEFHSAAEPTTFAVRLRNEDVWSAVNPDVFDNAVAKIEESLLTYHPISGTTVNQMLLLVDPGSEVTEEEDPNGNWDLDSRGWEPNVRLGWYHALWDAADDEWFVGVAPQSASASWSGWANPGSHAFWTMGNTTTPGHEMGHAQGLLHVPCKDTNEPFGVPDELAGGSIDLSYPTGLPNCSLAPVDPDGYFGFTTLEELPAIYSNDPNAPNARFPFMSYRNPEWTDPYHTCLLLDSYGVPCDPVTIGVPPLAAVADFGQADAFAQVLPDTGTWTPMLPGDSSDGPIVLFELSWEACEIGPNAQAEACDAASADGDGTTEHFFTVEIEEGEIGEGEIGVGPVAGPSVSECEGSTTSGSGGGSTPTTTVAAVSGPHLRYVLEQCFVVSYSKIGPALVVERPTSGGRGLLERQLALTMTGAVDANSAVDSADLNSLGVNWQGASAAPLWVRVSDSTGRIPGRVMPIALDGLGHGGGVEVRSESNVYAAPWDAAYDTIEIVRPDGRVLDTISATRPPTLRIDDVVVDGHEVAVSWTGDDPDGDSLLYNVSMSADGGATWRPMEVLTSETRFIVTADHRAAGGDRVIVRVTATDGLTTSFVDSEPFPLRNAVPFVAMSATEATVPLYAPRTLRASAYDPEDGVIEAITWSSDVDGQLGVGRQLSTRWLTLGLHEIAVSVVDSTGTAASDTLMLEVVDDGRARPLVEGDVPEVDLLLRRAVVGGVEAGRAEPAASSLEVPAAPDELPATADDEPQDSDSNTGLTVLALAGVGAAGMGLGAAARRRRTGTTLD